MAAPSPKQLALQAVEQLPDDACSRVSSGWHAYRSRGGSFPSSASQRCRRFCTAPIGSDLEHADVVIRSS
jgi:hypothetical protein